MSPDERDLERFSRELDEEWLRRRLRVAAPTLIESAEREDLARALGRADPLGPSAGRGWLTALREALAAWPGRTALAASACALLVIGFVLGRVPAGRAPTQVAVISVPKPAWEPGSGTGLGLGATVHPESERKFREAMAFHNAPDFSRKALPLLQDAVGQDASNDQAQFWLGVVLQLEGRSADAVPALEKAVGLAPRSAPYKQYLLLAYLQAGANDKALRLQAELLRPR